MTDYSLWEVILNKDSPVPTRVVKGVLQPVALTTAEQKLARKNKLKAHGTLPDKHQLKFNSHMDAKTLIEAIEKRFEGNIKTKKVQKTLLKQHYENFTGSISESLDQIHDRLQKLVSQLEIHRANLEEQSIDDLFNSLKIYEAEVKNSSSTCTITQNLAFVSSSNTDSTTESVSATASVSTVCVKMLVPSLPNVDSLSNAIDVDDLEEMDLRWQMAMLTMRARRFLQKTRRNLGANRPTSMGFDMSKVECYNCHRKGYFARECRSLKDSRRNGATEPQRRTVPVETSTSNALVFQCNGVGSYDWSYQAEEEPANYALMAFSSSTSDNEVPSCSKACSKAYAQLHSQYDKLTADFRKSQFDVISYQTGLKYVEARLFQPSDGYHAVSLPYTGTFMPPKPVLVFNTVPTAVKTDHSAFTVQLSLTKPEQDLSHTNRPTTPIIEDWVFDSEDESETKAPQIVPSFVQSTEQVKSPRYSIQHVETSIPVDTPKPASPKPTSLGKRRNCKACFVCKSLDYLIKDCDYHAKKMAQPTPRNHAHRENHKQYAPLTHPYPQKHMVPAAVLTQSTPESITAIRTVSAVVPKIRVTRPRHAKPIVTQSNSPIKRHLTHSPSPKASNSPPIVTVVKAPVVSAAQVQGNPQCALKDKGVIDSGCSRHMTGTCPIYLILRSSMVDMLPLEVSQRVKNSVLFTDTECLVLSPDFKLPDESQVLPRVPRENNMMEGIKREFSVPRTPQQNGIAKRKNRTLIEAAKTMLVDLLLPIPFWAEAVNTACYVQNRVLVTKPHNKTPYELLHSRTPSIGFMRPFGCPVTILNTLDSLDKFDRKVDEGFLVGYSVSSKAFRVFNSRNRIVQETLHVNFQENKPNVAGSGPTWLFDIDSLTRTMNYQPVTAGNQTNHSAGFQDKFDAEKAGEEIDQQYVLFPVWSSGSTNPQNNDRDVAFDGKEPDFDAKKPESEINVSPSSSAQSRKQDDKTKKEAKGKSHVESFTGYRDLNVKFKDYSDNSINEVNAAGTIVLTVGQNSLNSTNTFSATEDITYFDDEDDVGAEADFKNLETSITEEPKRAHQALKDPSWIETMQEELLQFKMQKVWFIVNLPHGKRAIGTKWEERIDYEEVFTPVAKIEAIRLFLAYASFMGFMVYKMDVKSAFLYGTIEEEVYVCQPSGFEDPDHLDKIYKVVKALYGLHQAPRACYETLANYVLENEEKSASTPIDTEKPLLKDPDSEDVDVHTYRSMIGSLMYLTLSRPDIMFAIPQGQATLGVVVSKDSPFDLVVFSDSDYAGAILDKKSTTGGCQFLGCRLISWQCKKQTVIATSSTEAEYVAADSCCAHVLWIKNQLLDYGDSPLLGVNTPISDEDRLELMEFMVFLLPKVEKVRIGVNAVDLQVSAVRHKLLLFSLTNWCCSLSAVSSSMASAVICLSSGRKFNFSKYIFDDLVGDLSTHTTKYTSPALTPKVFANMRRVGKGFSGVETPLFEGMLVEQQVDKEGDAEENVEEVNASDAATGDVSAAHGEVPTVAEEQSIPSPTPPTPPPQPPQDIPSTSQGRMIGEMDQDDAVVLKDDKEEDREVADVVKDVEEAKVDESPAEVQELVDVVTTAKLITEVVTAASETVTAASVIITIAEAQVLAATLTAAPARVAAAATFLLKTKEQIEEDENRAQKKLNETPTERATKRRKLDEKVEELKRHLQIVPNKDDDVYTKTTSLTRKVPVVDYQITEMNNKPYYKIIRADDIH
nr:hypothetical protein [Tanacetum cinerariifolium]